MSGMHTVVVGAGAWGTALAMCAARQSPQVTLWARDAAQARALNAQRQNQRYLADVDLPTSLRISHADLDGPDSPLHGADVVIIGTPMAGLRPMLHTLRDHPGVVAWLCKGFEMPQAEAVGWMGHEIAAAVAPALRCGVLSGPSFALEVARGQPTALVAASENADVRAALVEVLHGPSMRIYANDDVVGVEVGGAVKNVLAIATGLCDGLGLGLNARAALITRGLAEMQRLGLALGARSETFMGLSGLGDLVLTATGDLSRNRKVGQCLAQGMSLQQAVDSLGHVAEGVYSARTVVQRAAAVGVDMPIAQAVVELLDGQSKAHDVVKALMARDPREEAA
jgi:glycerol-3-phosphate dehydrogenase (NAD(P)+)